MKHYFILTTSTHFVEVLRFVKDKGLKKEMHLNRTRFWIPTDSAVYTEFALKLSDYCQEVDESLDLMTGR
jgi:hypothetical protein